MKRILTYFSLSLLLIATSCTEENTNVEKDNYDRSDSLSTEYTSEVAVIRGNIKEISQYYMTLKNLGAEFNSSLPNSPSKASSYSTTAQKCIGIGIYGADLNYLVINAQNETAKASIEAISRLANELGIESAFDQSLFGRIVSEQDSVKIEEKSNLVSKAFRNAEDKMYNEERALFATLMVAGGWVESVYLTSSIILNTNISESNLSDFWLLSNNYNSIVKMLTVFSADANAKEMLDKLNSIEGAVKAITDQPRVKLENVTNLNKEISVIRASLI